MTEKQIQYFMKSYELRNIAAAAETLYVTRSGVSHAISELEGEFGVVLFHRVKQGIVPTEAANELYEMFSNMNAYYRSISEKFKKKKNSENTESFTLGVSITNVRTLSYIVYDNFLPLHPNINVKIKELPIKNRMDYLTDGTVDFITSTENIQPSSIFRHLDLYEVKMVFALNSASPLAQRDNLSVTDIINYKLGFLDVPPTRTMLALKERYAAFGKEPEIALETSDLHILHKFIRNNKDAAVMLPDNVIQYWNDVKGVPVDQISHISTNRLIWNSARQETEAMKTFIEFMKTRDNNLNYKIFE